MIEAMRSRLVAMILWSAAALVACTPFNPLSRALTSEEADSQAQIWQRADVSDYTLTVALRCFCEGITYSVEVHEGIAGEVTPLQHSDLSFWSQKYKPRTVEDLYALIHRLTGTADSVDVAYNEYGVPINISVDRERNAVDDELGYRVRFDSAAA